MYPVPQRQLQPTYELYTIRSPSVTMYRRKTFASLREETLDGSRASYNREPYDFEKNEQKPQKQKKPRRQQRQRPFSSSFTFEPLRGRSKHRHSLHGEPVRPRPAPLVTTVPPAQEEDEREFRKQQRHSRQPIAPSATPMRFLNLAGYTDKDGKYFYPTAAYTCLNEMPEQFCSPSQSCLCMNTRLLDELGVCVKLECVHGGDMAKFWRVMGRECDDVQGIIVGTWLTGDNVAGVDDVVPEPEPEPEPEEEPETDEEENLYQSSDYGDHFRYFKEKEREEREWEKECRRRDMALLDVPRPRSPAPTQMSEEPALTITVTKTVSIEVQSLRTMDTIDCRTVRNMCLDNGESGSSAVWDKSFFRGEDEESEIGGDWDYERRTRARSRSRRRPSASRPSTARPQTGRSRMRPFTPAQEPPKEPELMVNVPCHDVVDFLKKFGVTPKKVAGMVKKVKNVFGRAATA
ncbi:hypothetical protein Dda_5638 [Drechslerella dactyloides]|uniref:Uncharacterized protein n=1 Tax=Drechslerella dactyloides TaxID=74499 RepID=A0AAD6IWK8_DREDA|nr:hypothetical protein Dda_5638 [Drechslerella dactyloides]